MIAANRKDPAMDQRPPTTWQQAWHLWTVIFPRRSITGRLVYGKVWRRHNGRHWIYKKSVRHAHDGDE
jgi:hypothetical protein